MFFFRCWCCCCCIYIPISLNSFTTWFGNDDFWNFNQPNEQLDDVMSVIHNIYNLVAIFATVCCGCLPVSVLPLMVFVWLVRASMRCQMVVGCQKLYADYNDFYRHFRRTKRNNRDEQYVRFNYGEWAESLFILDDRKPPLGLYTYIAPIVDSLETNRGSLGMTSWRINRFLIIMQSHKWLYSKCDHNYRQFIRTNI